MSSSGSISDTGPGRGSQRARFARLAQLALLALLLVLTVARAQGDVVIHVILSEADGAYREVADALRAALGPRAVLDVTALAELSPERLRELSRGTELLAPVGLQAVRALAAQHQGRAPVLMLMVPRASAERVSWPPTLTRGKVAAVYIDQPPARSLALAQRLLPAARRIGVVVSADHPDGLAALRQEAVRRRMDLQVETIAAASDLSRALRRVLSESDVLVLLPDALVVNAENVRNVLLTTYRYRIPVIGFSEGLARAGAVASVYSSPAQIGRQGALLIRAWAAGRGELPDSTHADTFSLAFNPHVARSLGVTLADPAALRQELGAANE